MEFFRKLGKPVMLVMGFIMLVPMLFAGAQSLGF